MQGHIDDLTHYELTIGESLEASLELGEKHENFVSTCKEVIFIMCVCLCLCVFHAIWEFVQSAVFACVGVCMCVCVYIVHSKLHIHL